MGCCCGTAVLKEGQALTWDEDEFAKLHVESGHMNERRRSYVGRLYRLLGDETTLQAEAMGAAFDADSHPDVVNGNRESKDVRHDLVEALAVGGGPVSLKLFEDYYDTESITIEADGDEQFEALVSSSWILFLRQRAAAARAAAPAPAPATCIAAANAP